jgi:hypothetical protein
MLAATLPHVQLWNAWYTAYGNDPGQVPALLGQIDEACVAAGRQPLSLLKTLAMLWQFETTPVARDAGHRITGRPAMIDALSALDAAGLATVQLVLDPITPGTIEQVVEIVAAWRSGRD